MISRVQARDDRIMVGESQRGEHRNQSALGFGPISNQSIDVGKIGLVLIPEPESVGGDDYDDGVLELGERTRELGGGIEVDAGGGRGCGEEEEGECGSEG